MNCPEVLKPQIQDSLAILNEGFNELSTSYHLPIPPLIARPALQLTGFLASSVYLLEHAIWSYTSLEAERDADIEAFRRWVLEGGIVAVLEDVRQAKQTRSTNRLVQSNSMLVFGVSSKAKL